MAKTPKCFSCKDVFPFMLEVIGGLCRRRQGHREARHEEIVDRLIVHPETSKVIGLAMTRCPRYTKRWIASTMVKWMSQHYTMENADTDIFRQRFQRREDENGNWAYSNRSPIREDA